MTQELEEAKVLQHNRKHQLIQETHLLEEDQVKSQNQLRLQSQPHQHQLHQHKADSEGTSLKSIIKSQPRLQSQLHQPQLRLSHKIQEPL